MTNLTSSTNSSTNSSATSQSANRATSSPDPINESSETLSTSCCASRVDDIGITSIQCCWSNCWIRVPTSTLGPAARYNVIAYNPAQTMTRGK